MANNLFGNEERPVEVTRKMPLKQVLFGFNQLVSKEIPQHEKLMRDGLDQLQKATVTAKQKGKAQIKEALKMLQRDLKQIAEMKHNVCDGDFEKFCESADPVCKSVNSLILSTSNAVITVYDLELEEERNHQDSESAKLISHSDQIQMNADIEEQILAEENDELRRKADNIKEVAQEMEALHELINTLNKHLENQGEVIQRIEQHVDFTHANVQSSETLLTQARNYKTAVLPAVGLTVGFAAGGPIGAIAGFRIGLATSFIGGALGYTGGKVIHQFNRLKFFPTIPQID